MPPIIPRPFEPTGTGKSGFSISVGTNRGGQHIRVGITQSAQEAHFGRKLSPTEDALRLELNNDQGKNHILKLKRAKEGEPGALSIAGGIKGSISIKLAPWSPLAQGKRPATELAVISGSTTNAIQLKLPDYAQPSVRKIGEGKPLMD